MIATRLDLAFQDSDQFMQRNRVQIRPDAIPALHSARADDKSVLLQPLENVHQQRLRQAISLSHFPSRYNLLLPLGQMPKGNQSIIGFSG